VARLRLHMISTASEDWQMHGRSSRDDAGQAAAMLSRSEWLTKVVESCAARPDRGQKLPVWAD